jgi:DNA repair protein RecO
MAATRDLGLCAVLRLQPVGDSDLIVGLLSETEGRVDAVARGGRNSKKRFAGVLRPFQTAQVALQAGRGALPLLADLTPVTVWMREEVGWSQLCLASLATELAQIASQPSHADPELLQWLQGAWEACAALDEGATAHLRQLRLAMEVTFLAVVGAMPDLQACVRCGRDLALGAIWPPDADAPLCPGCTPVVPAWLLAEPLRQALLATLRGETTLRNIWLPPEGRNLAQDRVSRLLRHAVPGQLRSLPMVEQLLAAT